MREELIGIIQVFLDSDYKDENGCEAYQYIDEYFYELHSYCRYRSQSEEYKQDPEYIVDKLFIDNGFTINPEDSYGGEGKGNDYWLVFSAEKNGEKKFFRLDGWYASHHGAELNEINELYEVEKVPVHTFKWKAKNAN